MPINPLTIEELTKQARILIRSAKASSFALAELVLEARESAFSETSPWLKWTADLGFSRRYSFQLLNVAKIVRTLRAKNSKLLDYDGLTIFSVDLLSQIPEDRLDEFLSANCIPDLDREELRAAIRTFLGREAPHYDMFERFHLPDPEEFWAMLQKNLGEVPANKAADYGSAIIRAASMQRDKLTPAEHGCFEDNLWMVLQELTGKDYHALCQKLNIA